MHKSINQAITLSTNQLMRWQNDKSQIFAYHLKYVEYEEYFSFHSQGSFECFFGLFFVLVNVTFYYDPLINTTFFKNDSAFSWKSISVITQILSVNLFLILYLDAAIQFLRYYQKHSRQIKSKKLYSLPKFDRSLLLQFYFILLPRIICQTASQI